MRTATRTTTSGRVRREPQRTCVACRRTGDQPSFVRLVRSPEGDVQPDEGKRRSPGRGAYLCRNRSCWERGLRGALAGALRTTLTEADRGRLRAYADAFTDDTEQTAPAAGAREGEEA